MPNIIENHNVVIVGNQIQYTDLKTGETKTKPFNLTLQNVRNQFKKMNYKAEYDKTGRIKNKLIENYHMQPFAFVYYYWIAIKGRIPTPMELTSAYLQLFCKKLDNGKYTFKEKYLLSDNIEFNPNDLKARIMRAYNSYNREIEFFINLSENLKGIAEVKYDLQADAFDGIDLLIKYKDKTIGIATYVDTKQSNAYKEKKNTFRHDYSKIEMIDVIATMNGPNQNVVPYGDVLAYSQYTVNSICNKIKNSAT